MKRCTFSIIFALACHCLSYGIEPGEETLFARDIQPLIASKCLICHGPDEAEGGLRLDLFDHATAKLESGNVAVAPGKPNESELLHRVTSEDSDLRMPPEGDALSPRDVEHFRRWIAGGAKYQTHWAYQPVSEPKVPEISTDQSQYIENDIDRYLVQSLSAEGVQLSPTADRATLMKRLYYDLLGLPPTPEEVDAFVANEADDAYESLVDQLLSRKQFAERWARHWLDKARYADSDGYEKDRPRPNAWRYRDWVIDAIDRDIPFDQFTIMQLAGDLLPEATTSDRLATAFHRQTLTNTEGGTDQEQFRIEATFDRTETTAAVWMGLTMTCARCHSHKYDQISQKEYYQLFAFFNDCNETNLDVARSEAEHQAYLKKKATHESQQKALEQKLVDAKAAIGPEVESWLAEMRKAADAAAPIEAEPAVIIEGKSDSGAEIHFENRSMIEVTGKVADKDEYTLVAKAPSKPFTGIRIKALHDPSLPGKGPGRAPNGNFVLTQLRLYFSDNPDFKKDYQAIQPTGAEASFSQNKFPPQNALAKDTKTGWAIAPKMGSDQTITFYTSEPVAIKPDQFMQIVLDQQYGGQHLLGKFSIELLSGFDPLRSLPPAVAAAVRTPNAKQSDQQRQAITDHVAAQSESTKTILQQIKDHSTKAPKSPLMSVRILRPAERTTKLLSRGDFLQPQDAVSHSVLDVISATHPLEGRDGSDDRPDRLDLARWLVDPSHPLSSRVTVNHIWAHLFGRGIVETSNDFGVRGESPTHQALLDYLAWQFPRDLGYSRKQLVKTIVMSHTYRQSSHFTEPLLERDPTNRLFARQNRMRVQAEVVRDLFLSVGGLLSDKVGGPSVFPPLPPGIAELSYANNFKWKTSRGEDRYRRGMYTFFKRTSPHPNLISFDCPDSNTTSLRRQSSNTPLQALITLNNEVFNEAAQGFAKRILSYQGDDQARVRYGLRCCIAREPSDAELAEFTGLLNDSRSYYADHSDDATAAIKLHPAPQSTPEENASWVATARIMMNLDEFIVRQ